MFIYLAPPALYFHVKTFLFSDTKLRAKDFKHTIVYFAAMLGVLALILSGDENGEISPEKEYKVGLIYYAALYIQIYTYLFLSHRILSKHKEIFFENYSNKNTKR